ncbi:hypothetical protein SAMN05421736_11247 [Evansella caseinilytica]|uniref:Uncharacterized protein n=1 Tax=Evansella caseinilytica TaxID=1503961 RepID=A0A1H3SUH7_9BACI|nr:hypothetical protein [Evansella caseinilytica]SDZ41604.1 hypothetical protein SAMN05421736_11247 [Evansella caseinilytica]
MIQSKQDYLTILEQELHHTADKDELIREMDLHISELLHELALAKGLGEGAAMPEIVERLGAPEHVAAQYQTELEVTPKKVQWTFISVNIVFFIGGICLTLLYNLLPLPFVSHVWTTLTSITAVIIILYMLFWMLLGYEIGKEFGLGGRRLLIKTFYIALMPNILLMGLVVFRLMPMNWFDPLLTPPFIAVCILSTIVLYPVSYVGFRWGTIQSV